jgi:hypothetical protein
MSIICCPECDWTGHDYEAGRLSIDQLNALKPGSVVPLGACPLCKAVLVPGSLHESGVLDPTFDWDSGRAERGNLTQYQRDCLLSAIAHLVPEHPGFNASNEIAVALLSNTDAPIPIPDNRAPPFNNLTMAPYMHSWVYPLLIGALYGEPWSGHRNTVHSDAEIARNKMKAAADAAQPAKAA